jgi:uridine phosphorylase
MELDQIRGQWNQVLDALESENRVAWIAYFDARLSSFESDGLQILNFEMESSAIFALGREMGHECATICLGVANRPNMQFSKGYETELKGLIILVLNRI